MDGKPTVAVPVALMDGLTSMYVDASGVSVVDSVASL